MKPKVIRTATIPLSLDLLLKGQLSFLNKYFEIIAISGKDVSLTRVEKREKIKTIPIHFERRISIFKDLKSLFKLYIILKKEKPVIIHSITPKAGLISMVAGYLAGIPIRIHTFTGLIFPSQTGLMKILLINMDRILCLFATKIIPEGEGVKNDLIKYKITKKQLNIIAYGNVNGIDTQYFSPSNFTEEEKQKLKTQLDILPNDFVWIFVGRLVGDKGINELVQAFKNLQKEQPHTKLLLVGNEEPNLDPLQAETLMEIQQNKNIITTGWVEDVRPYFAIADALAFPSYREGFPNVVLQAGAMGLPSIVSNINGCNEIITNRKNGLIIPPKNVEELYKAMLEVLKDKKLTQSLSRFARKEIVERFEQSIVWEALLQEYQYLLHEQKRNI